MKQYLDLLRKVRTEGCLRKNRTGVKAYSLFGYQLRINLDHGFPLLTTKKLHFRSIAYELLWFLRGDTNIAFLKENKVSIWDEWADEKGELGPIYGKQWRAWQKPDGSHVDQISRVVEGLKEDPLSRRHIVSAWNVSQLEDMALFPCHILFQFYLNRGSLSCLVYQRSADVFLGVPFNIASYALLLLLMAQVAGTKPGELIYTFGDAHLYENHSAQADEQLSRRPCPLPLLRLNPKIRDIFDFSYQDMQLQNYVAAPHIRAEVAI